MRIYRHEIEANRTFQRLWAYLIECKANPRIVGGFKTRGYSNHDLDVVINKEIKIDFDLLSIKIRRTTIPVSIEVVK